MREPMIGECGRHPGQRMVNCPLCAIDIALAARVRVPASEIDALLCDVAQLVDGWKNADPKAWTAWDQSVRDRVTEMRKRLTNESH